jgi:hypothetical protein
MFIMTAKTKVDQTDRERANNVFTELLKSGWTTVLGAILVTGVTYGTYTASQKFNEAKFTELNVQFSRSVAEAELKITKNEARIATMESIGHPDHERRISKVEIRVDNLDQRSSETNAKLDTTIAILNRVEASLKAGVKP